MSFRQITNGSNLKLKEMTLHTTKSKLCHMKNWWKFWGSMIRSWNWIESHVKHLVYFVCEWVCRDPFETLMCKSVEVPHSVVTWLRTETQMKRLHYPMLSCKGDLTCLPLALGILFGFTSWEGNAFYLHTPQRTPTRPLNNRNVFARVVIMK